MLDGKLGRERVPFVDRNEKRQDNMNIETIQPWYAYKNDAYYTFIGDSTAEPICFIQERAKDTRKQYKNSVVSDTCFGQAQMTVSQR